jgi:outer membrane immunogenic protein
MWVGIMRGSGVLSVVCGCALAACFARAGLAADLEIGVPARSPVTYVSPYFNWEGIYIGAFVGDGFGTAKWAAGSVPVTVGGTAHTFFFPSAQVSTNGVVGGGRLGMNFQSEAWVWGFEADFTGMHVSGSATGVDAFGDQSQNQTTANWSAQIGIRAGYSFYNFLFYGKAGAAVVQDSEQVTYAPQTISGTPFGGVSTGTATRFGFLLGTGLEYGFDRHWSASLEYQYIRLGNQLINFTPSGPVTPGQSAPPPPGIPASQRTIDLNVQRIIAGVNYRFY